MTAFTLGAAAYAIETALRAPPSAMAGFGLHWRADDPDLGVRVVSSVDRCTRLRARGSISLPTPGYITELSSTLGPAFDTVNGRRALLTTGGLAMTASSQSLFSSMHLASGSCTWSSLVRVDSTSVDGRIARTAAGADGFFLQHTTGDKFTIDVFEGAVLRINDLGASLSAGGTGLHLVTVRKSGLNFDVRVDGASATAAAASLAASGNAQDVLTFGATSSGTAGFAGAFCEVYYHPTASLSDSVIDTDWHDHLEQFWGTLP